MSRMGEELDRRLDENKYEMYEALKLLCKTYDVEVDTSPDNLEYYGEDWQSAIKVLAEVEK